MAFQCNKCRRTVGCNCPEVAEEVAAAMGLAAYIMDVMGSPAGALGEVAFNNPEARALYEKLWYAVVNGSKVRDKGAPGEPAWERLLDPKL